MLLGAAHNELVHRLAPPLGATRAETGRGVEALCPVILRVDHQLQQVASRMLVLDELGEALQSCLAVAATLEAMVDKEMEDPVLVRSAGLVGERDEPDHGGARIDGIGRPRRAAQMEVRLGKRDGNDGSVLGDEALLVGAHGEAERFLPVRLRDLAQLDVHRPPRV